MRLSVSTACGALQPILQATAIDEFQREVRAIVGFAVLVELHDVRVLQTSGRFGFRAKSIREFRRHVLGIEHHLERDGTLDCNLPGR